MKKNYRTDVVVAIVVLLLAFFVCRYYLANKDRTENKEVFLAAILSVEKFHNDLKDIRLGLKSKDAQEIELGMMKRKSDDAKEALQDLKVKSYSRQGQLANAVNEVIEKSERYIVGFSDYASQKISKEALIDKGEDMIASISTAKILLGVPGSPGSGDVTDAIDRSTKLVGMYQKTTTAVLAKADPGLAITEGSDYWADSEYSDYRNRIIGIIADYNQGRKMLGRVMNNYDQGMLTNQDRASWSDELNRRRSLLRELDDVWYSIPKGTVYASHHRLVSQMLRNAISAMENFQNCENSYSRDKLHRISDENNAIMAKLRAFYGIRR